MTAKLISIGDVVKYTPIIDVAKGTVVKEDNLVGIANFAILADEQGSLNIGGLFQFPIETGSVFVFGDKVYIDLVTQEITDSAADTYLGTFDYYNDIDDDFGVVLLNTNFAPTPAGGGDMLGANNLSEITNKATARLNAGFIALKNIYQVDIFGNDTTGDGSRYAPYATIAKALSMIITASPVNPFLIQLGVGEWTEDITLKSNVFFNGMTTAIYGIPDNLTILSGNITGLSTIGVQLNTRFSNVVFTDNTKVISLTGLAGADFISVDFSKCRFDDMPLVADIALLLYNDCNIDVPTGTGITVTNGIMLGLKFCLVGDTTIINTDATTEFAHLGTEFNRSIAVISGTETKALDSENINYDNTISGLSASNVEAAIDELKSLIIDAPAETLTSGGALIGSGADKATPVDADEFPLKNSVGGLQAKSTWANIKATILAAITNAFVTAKVITGYISGAGTVADTDTILQAIQKLNGNTALKVALAGAETITGAKTFSDERTNFGYSANILSTSANVTHFLHNLYLDGANFKYKTTGAGSIIYLDETGAFVLYTAPSGTADTIATISNRFQISQTGVSKFLNRIQDTRISRRSPAITQAAEPTINTDVTDVAHITGLASNITSMTTNLTGTPVEGDTLRIDITGTAARTIAWGASFESSGGATLPTTTVGTTRLDVGFVWNTATNKWLCVAVV